MVPLLLLIFLNYCSGSNVTTQHRIQFKNETGTYNFVEILGDRSSQNDVFYAIMGHPREPKATKAHLDGYNSLNLHMRASNFAVKASILNGDLPQPWAHQPTQEQSYWGSSEWVVDYGRQKLGFNWDQPEAIDSVNFDFLGIETHSWRDCIVSLSRQQTACIHIIQIRNYRKFYPKELESNKLGPIYSWINKKVHQSDRRLDPTLVVFQEFDTNVHPLIREFTKEGHLYNVTETKLIGIIFTLMSNDLKLEWKFCLENSQIPIVSMGALAENEYLLFQLENRGIKDLYKIDAINSTQSFAYDYNFKKKPCVN